MILSPAQNRLVASVHTGLFINGAWREASDGARVQVEDPSTGVAFATVADATVTDGDNALAAAWRRKRAGPPPRRASAATCCARHTGCSPSGPRTSRPS